VKDRSTIRDATGILGIAALLGSPSVSICMQRTNHPAGGSWPLSCFLSTDSAAWCWMRVSQCTLRHSRDTHCISLGPSLNGAIKLGATGAHEHTIPIPGRL
jgi:hypothetical protein